MQKMFFKTLITVYAITFASLGFANGEAVFERKLQQAENGDVEAQYDVGYRYEKGRGIDEDVDEAFIWYNKAAEYGLDKAQYKIGTYYVDGIGVEPDAGMAEVWLKKAADQGYPPAQYELGKLYASKHKKKYEQAMVWLQKAQDNGYSPATKEIRKVKKKLN